MSDERISSIKTLNHSITPKLNYYGTKTRVQFNWSCLKQDKLMYTHGTKVNIYIVYELGTSGSFNNDPTLKNSLLSAVKLTKNADIDKYQYSGYGVGFDGKGSFLFPGGGFGQNVIIFGVDMSSSVHVDNKKNDILILGKSSTQGLGGYSLTAEKLYSVNFTVTRKRFCLSWHCNGTNSYLFLNGTEIKFKRDCCNCIMSRKYFKRLVSR